MTRQTLPPALGGRSGPTWSLRSSPPSYAHEQLSSQLAALSTLPISLSASASISPSTPTQPNPAYESALHELSSSQPVSRDVLVDVLRNLSSLSRQASAGSGPQLQLSSVDATLHAEVMGRAVTMVWTEVMEVLIAAALALEEERGWWETSVNSRRGVGIYLIQSERPLCVDFD